MHAFSGVVVLSLTLLAGCNRPIDHPTQLYLLTVSVSGTGEGLVTSGPAGISCGTACSQPFKDSTAVTLTASADAGSAFSGWSGSGCAGAGACVVTMTANVTVTATFQVPPKDLVYTSSQPHYTVGVTIPPNGPSSSGGPVVSYSVSPDLPDGLSLDRSTGVISGTPTVTTAATVYTVTAANEAGSTTATVMITVDSEPPRDLTYSANPATYTAGVGIAPNIASSSGGMVVSYSLSRDLPAGLSLDTATGVIFGTPKVTAAPASYIVTATNPNGATSATLTITVGEVAPGMSGLITAGDAHSCAIVDGGVRCWGYNGAGALGNTGVQWQSQEPVAVSGLSNVQAIAAGSDHACALASGGVQCWGANASGQLGNGFTTNSYVPLPVPRLTSGVQAIAAGCGHTCAIVNGGMWCWGRNDHGQLGYTTMTTCSENVACSSEPFPVPELTSGVQAIAAGCDHTCAVVNGGVQCWGANDSGQLGYTTTTICDGNVACSTKPFPVSELTSGVQAIAAGAAHTCAIMNGGIQCWGENGCRQLGYTTTTRCGYYACSTQPLPVSEFTSGVQAVAAGAAHTCALVNRGIWCWGRNRWGELGFENNLECSQAPAMVPELRTGAQAIAAGSKARAGGVGPAHTCALVNGGALCWGLNDSGQLGYATTTTCHDDYLCSKVPSPVSGLASGVP